jgi:hypothetical protein
MWKDTSKIVVANTLINVSQHMWTCSQSYIESMVICLCVVVLSLFSLCVESVPCDGN